MNRGGGEGGRRRDGKGVRARGQDLAARWGLQDGFWALWEDSGVYGQGKGLIHFQRSTLLLGVRLGGIQMGGDGGEGWGGIRVSGDDHPMWGEQSGVQAQ